ncbi:hypothetical protein RRG53_03360 [Mycoplasmopsis cynos]|uniref:Mbov_0401 family ICE element transposase-like protein n=1 Tax=Mycoplasmopsis cynos TaxID=171284 RepID=UPI002AFEB4D5|nr:hypothetical protein [Mycoplasmopsis cynos]WQQ18316.1 hypothetical protein RRG53_03360 [Mycoplasmopsis cynos]
MSNYKKWVNDDINKMVQNWNNEEEIFRTKIRLENNKFKTWKVKKIRRRKIIINGNDFEYKLGVYIDKNTRKSFTYYHNNELKRIGKNKYYYKDIYNQFSKQIWARRKCNEQKLIPKYVLDYHLKIGNLSYDFKNSKNNFDTNNLVQIHIDDTYIKENLGHKKVKRCLRNVFLIDKNNQIHTLIFKENYKNLTFICSKIKEFFGHNFDVRKIKISGDGAKFINTISQNLGVKRYYDLYHFKKYLFNVFGYTRTKNKQNYNFLRYFGIENLYEILNNFLEKLDFLSVIMILKNIINFLKNTKTYAKKLKEIKSFLRFFIQNEKYIFNTFLRENYHGGRAEIYIYHIIKTPIYKRFSLFNWKNYKNLIQLKSQKISFDFY